MLKKPIMAIDCDDVVVDFINPFLAFYKSSTGKHINYEEVFTYDLWGVFGCTREETVEAARGFYRTRKFDELSPNQEAIETIPLIAGLTRPFILTARYAEAKPKTIDFFARFFPELRLEIEFAGEFQDIPISKAEVCRRREATHIIEDNAHYALQCAQAGITAFLVARPWNKNSQPHPNIIPVNSLQEVIPYLS
mgnify:CR=1 FL=1